jgi:hypothetical protein
MARFLMSVIGLPAEIHGWRDDRKARSSHSTVIVRESGRSSIPETAEQKREAAAYWITRLHG